VSADVMRSAVKGKACLIACPPNTGSICCKSEPRNRPVAFGTAHLLPVTTCLFSTGSSELRNAPTFWG
jgi:hypothetical protein